jgi:PAS domain-containing protein
MVRQAGTNLFDRDPLYTQKSWLLFTTPSQEQRYSLSCEDTLHLNRRRPPEYVVACASVLLLLFSHVRSFGLGVVLGGLLMHWTLFRRDLDKLMVVLLAVVPTLWETVETTEHTFAVFLPMFAYFGVILKNWLLCGASIGLSGMVTVACHSVSSISVMLAFAVYVGLAAVNDRDSRDFWVQLDSFRRSCQVYFDLFNRSQGAVFVTCPDTRVLYANAKAKALMTGSELPFMLNSLTDKTDAAAIQEAVQACLKGEAVEFEVELTRMVRGTAESQGTFLVLASPMCWRQANCIKLSLTKISSVSHQRSLLLRQTKEVNDSLKLVLRAIDSAYKNNEPLMSNDVYRLYSVQHLLQNSLTYQMLSSKKVEVGVTHFDFKQELIEKIEEASYKFLMREIELKLTFDANLPRVVAGDAVHSVHLVKTLTEFAGRYANNCSSMQLVCEYHVTHKQSETVKKTIVKLTWGFITGKITQDELQLIFDTRNQDQTDKLLKLTELYGSSIALLPLVLEVVKGKMVTCHIKEGSVTRAFISIL